MISLIKTRMLLTIFFACLLPSFSRSLHEPNAFTDIFTIFLSVLVLVYLTLFTYCGFKLKRLKNKYSKKQ